MLDDFPFRAISRCGSQAGLQRFHIMGRGRSLVEGLKKRDQNESQNAHGLKLPEKVAL